MKHWIFTFRPETYELVKTHQTIGVGIMHERRFLELSEGDRFVTYVTKKALLDGYGALAGAPYADEEPIFGAGQNYPYRCRVNFAETGLAVAGKDALWGLSPFTGIAMKTTPTNYIFLKGGFLEISPQDYEWLLEVMHGKASVAR